MPDWGEMIHKYSKRGLEFRKSAIVLFFIGYTLVATLGMVFAEKREYFPFFSWSLFTYVWETSWGYEVEISRVDDRIYNPPVNFYELKQYFPQAAMRSINILKAAAGVRKAQDTNPEELTQLRALIENVYLAGPRRVDYSVVLVVYDPLERWKTGKIKEKLAIGSFSMGDRH